MPVVNILAQETKKGVTFKVKRERSRKLLRGAFIAQMPRTNPNRKGHLGVFFAHRSSHKHGQAPDQRGLHYELRRSPTRASC